MENLTRKDNEKLISFIVPVYNMSKYLDDCFKSLLCQDIDSDEYEIVCINDGSTDNSLEILNAYEEKYDNVKVIDVENGGVAAARNIGIDASCGKYIWFVDSDDCVRGNCLGELKKMILKHNPEILKFKHKCVWEDFKFREDFKKEFKLIENLSPVGPCVWSFLTERRLLDENNIRFALDMEYCEDALFTYYIYIYMNPARSVAICDELYLYRLRSESVSHTIEKSQITKQTLGFIDIARKYKSEYDRKIVDDEEKLQATKRRQHLAVINGLTFMPETNLDLNETLEILEKEGLYPFPMVWRHIRESGGIRKKILEFLRNLFNIKPLYVLYYKLAAKNEIVKKHRQKTWR